MKKTKTVYSAQQNTHSSINSVQLGANTAINVVIKTILKQDATPRKDEMQAKDLNSVCGILKRTTTQNKTLKINLTMITAQISPQGIKKLKAIKHRMSVEGKDVDFLIDTGASVNVLPSKYVTQQLEPYEGKLLMWNNSETQPKGQCRLKLINPKTSM